MKIGHRLSSFRKAHAPIEAACYHLSRALSMRVRPFNPSAFDIQINLIRPFGHGKDHQRKSHTLFSIFFVCVFFLMRASVNGATIRTQIRYFTTFLHIIYLKASRWIIHWTSLCSPFTVWSWCGWRCARSIPIVNWNFYLSISRPKKKGIIRNFMPQTYEM